MAKLKNRKDGLVYTTDPDFEKNDFFNFSLNGDEPAPKPNTAAKQHDMVLRVWIEKKHRGGKEVTLVKGFKGKLADLEALGKTLKTKCGVGGSVKDGEIILQGNHKDKVVKMLLEMGYVNTKGAGG